MSEARSGVEIELRRKKEVDARPHGGRPAAVPPASVFEFEHVTSDDGLARLEPEWLDLFARSGTRNPFAHPACVRAWLQHFAPRADQRVIVTARFEGKLVAVAPFAVRKHGSKRFHARSLELIGAGAAQADRFTEMTEILVAREKRRKTLRALLHHLTLEQPTDWDWLVVTLPPDQGWFEDDWLPAGWLRRGARALHRATLPFVVMPLPSTWGELPLKHNMKEAIRRSKNRLAAGAAPPEVLFAEGAEAGVAIARLQELHSRRATVVDHRAHDDYFANDATARFARDGALALAAVGNGTVAELSVGGATIAARLVLHANDALFLSYSGVDPEQWRLGAPTFLIAASIRRAIEQGDKLVNLSLIPDSAKLRWSEQLELHNEFVVVAPTQRAQRMFAVYWHARAHRALRRGPSAPDPSA